MLIDTHAHLDFPELAGELDAVLARAAEAGVTRVIVRPWSRSSEALDGLRRFADAVLAPGTAG